MNLIVFGLLDGFEELIKPSLSWEKVVLLIIVGITTTPLVLIRLCLDLD